MILEAKHLQPYIGQQEQLSKDRWRKSNRCLMHRGVANYEMDQHRRIMKRVCVEGPAVD